MADRRVKLKDRKKRNKYQDLATEQKKPTELEGDSDTNCNWCTWNNSKRIGKETRRLENKRTSGDHPDNNIIKISQNTEKSPGDLRRLDVTQTPVKKPSANAGVKNSQMSQNQNQT